MDHNLSGSLGAALFSLFPPPRPAFLVLSNETRRKFFIRFAEICVPSFSGECDGRIVGFGKASRIKAEEQHGEVQ
jgi:hypothetical protein